MHLHGIFCCILCWCGNDPHRVVAPMGKKNQLFGGRDEGNPAMPRNFVNIFAVLDPNSSIEYHWIPWVFKLLPFWISENRLRFSEHLGVAFLFGSLNDPIFLCSQGYDQRQNLGFRGNYVDIIWYYVANYPNLHDPDQISNLVLSFTRPPLKTCWCSEPASRVCFGVWCEVFLGDGFQRNVSRRISTSVGSPTFLISWSHLWEVLVTGLKSPGDLAEWRQFSGI